jgi:septum formation topological specificity factor MinE
MQKGPRVPEVGRPSRLSRHVKYSPASAASVRERLALLLWAERDRYRKALEEIRDSIDEDTEMASAYLRAIARDALAGKPDDP